MIRKLLNKIKGLFIKPKPKKSNVIPFRKRNKPKKDGK